MPIVIVTLESVVACAWGPTPIEGRSSLGTETIVGMIVGATVMLLVIFVLTGPRRR